MPSYHLVGAIWIALTARADAHSGLTLAVYNNTALAGLPSHTRLSPTASFILWASTPLSAGLTGTLTADAGCEYAFECDFGRVSLGTLHVDDHLVCQFGANFRSNLTRVDNPLPARSRKQLGVRLAVVSNETSEHTRQVAIRVNATASCASPVGSRRVAAPVAFSPALPALEVRRERMQRSLAQGWGLWYDMSVLTHVLLPEGAALTVALCELLPAAPARCITQARTDWPPDDAGPTGSNTSLRLGLHAYDRSYAQLYVAGLGGCNVSVESGGGDGLLLAVRVVERGACDRHAIIFAGGSTWSRAVAWRAGGVGAGETWRAGEVRGEGEELGSSGGHPHKTGARTLEGGSWLGFAAPGLRAGRLHVSAPSDVPAAALPAHLHSQPHVGVRLADTAEVALSSGAPLTYAAVVSKLAGARAVEESRYAAYGELAQLKQVVQAGVMWNVIYNPLELGPICPVIRGNP
jgi:hypothetical protein